MQTGYVVLGHNKGEPDFSAWGGVASDESGGRTWKLSPDDHVPAVVSGPGKGDRKEGKSEQASCNHLSKTG